MALVDPGPAGAAVASGRQRLIERFVPSIMNGDKLGCGAVREPNAGSNPREIQTTAARQGDRCAVKDTKLSITNGGVADVVLCICKVKDQPGLSQLLTDKAESPFTTCELDKLGLKASATSKLRFEDCLVPAENLSVVGAALRETLRGFERARPMLAVGAVGISQASVEAALAYAGERKQWGKTLAGRQTIQHMVAEMDSLTEVAHFLAYRAFYVTDQGVRAAREISMATRYYCESAVRVASVALQIHGACGLSREFPVEWCFRDARALTIPDGASEIQKVIVARERLQMSAF